MKFSDLTDAERKVWEAAATGKLVDLRVGNPELDSPERWAEWGTERTVRADVIADLLIGDGEAASVAVRGVRLQGARITGDLNLEATTLRCRFPSWTVPSPARSTSTRQRRCRCASADRMSQAFTHGNS